MGSINKTPQLFQSKPVFGLDIGKTSIKVIQINHDDPKGQPRLVGYGTADFDSSAINEGIIEKPELIAEAAATLFKSGLIGDITTKRVAIAIPAYRAFTRSMQLPALKNNELRDAVTLEVEQYLPVPLDSVYLDFTKISETKTDTEILSVAVPRNVVDSCLDLCAILDIEPVLIETTMNALGRAFSRDGQSDVTSLLIDFGSVSSDISIYDNGIITTSTVEGGGEDFTNAIKKALQVSDSEARIIKTKYGLGMSKRQAEIKTALDPTLQRIIKEIKRLMRYHTERYSSDRPIGQVITLGGGANLPGLSEYFTAELRIAVRACDPWQYFDYKHIQPPQTSDRPMYATAIGLAFSDSSEILL
jgi:type IV pilus assembly protein PilM